MSVWRAVDIAQIIFLQTFLNIDVDDIGRRKFRTYANSTLDLT